MDNDEWEVRVIRPHGPEFQAWKGSDEAEAREQYQAWKEDENISKVGLFVNGQWAEPPYERRGPGRPTELQGDYELVTVKIRKDLLAKIKASGKSRREYIEELLEQ